MILPRVLLWVIGFLVLRADDVAASTPAWGHVARADSLPVAIKAGRLIDGTGRTPIRNVVVLVQADTIVAVGRNLTIPDSARVIDLGSATLLPGLIDCHVHILVSSYEALPNYLSLTAPDKAINSLPLAQITIESGFTTVRIPGDFDLRYGHFDVRNGVERGIIQGPRILAAGPILAIHNRLTDLHRFNPDLGEARVMKRVRTRDDVVGAVQESVQHHADWISFQAPSDLLLSEEAPHEDSLLAAMLGDLVAEADSHGIPVAVHAHSPEDIRAAVLAGARSIEHGSFMDRAAIDSMRARGTFLVPTLYARQLMLEAMEERDAPEEELDRARLLIPMAREAFGRALRAGVKIAFGSDAGIVPHGSSGREFEMLVDAGMKPMQAIVAATSMAAELLGMEDRIGAIAPGMCADLIAVEGNPLRKITELQRVRFVMKGGVVIKNQFEQAAVSPSSGYLYLPTPR